MNALTKVAGRESVAIRLCREADREGILRLSAEHYGEKEQASEAYFDWLYGGTPAGRPIVAVAEDLESGRIVGFTWHVPLEVCVRGEEGLCLMGCNALVHPAFRLRGAYLQLRALTFEHVRGHLFTYGFPKPAAIYPHSKAGVIPVTRIPLLVRPLDADALAEARLSHPLLQLGLKLGWRLAGRALLRSRRPPSGSRVQISQEAGFDEGYDRFWGKVKVRYPIAVKRNRAFLEWRFCKPAFRSYRILAARAGEELAGYAVLRCASFRGLKVGLIMDFLVEDGARGEAAGLLLLEAATEHLRQEGAALAGCLLLSHDREGALLRRAGYVVCPERLAPQAFRLAARSFSPRLAGEFLTDARQWFITSANHDAV